MDTQFNPDYEVQNNNNLKKYDSFDLMPIFKDETEDQLNLLKGILSYGFNKPSPIQSYAIIPITEGNDMIAQAQSGTGKTATYVISSLNSIDFNLKDKKGRPVVQAIVIAPSHELAIQIHDVYKNIGQYMDLKIELCIGQRVSSKTNMQNIMEGKHILIDYSR